MSRKDWPKDPFIGGQPMSDDHPVIKYLDWQIACHSRALAAMCGTEFQFSVDRFRNDVDQFNIEDYGVPNNSFQIIEHTLSEIKRLSTQIERLNRERLRLMRDVDFHGFNYML